MKNEELYLEFSEVIKEGSEKFEVMKQGFNGYIDWIIAENSDLIKHIADKNQLFDLIVMAVCARVKVEWISAIQGWVFKQILLALDKTVITKYAGSDWFSVLQARATKELENLR
jgi:hypothetical protein